MHAVMTHTVLYTLLLKYQPTVGNMVLSLTKVMWNIEFWKHSNSRNFEIFLHAIWHSLFLRSFTVKLEMCDVHNVKKKKRSYIL